MASSNLHSYLNILSAGVYGAELLTLGTGFITILREHHVTEEMDWLYLLNIVKIFIISGYLMLQCCWLPNPEQKVCNRIVLGVMGFISFLAIAATILWTVLEVVRNANDSNENNDHLMYIVSMTCIFQTLLLGSYTVIFIRYMYHVEVNGEDEEPLVEPKGGNKAVESILNKMSGIK